MKNILKRLLFVIAAVVLASACVPVQDALDSTTSKKYTSNTKRKPSSSKPSSSGKTNPSSNNKKPSSSSSSSSSSSKTNTADAVYNDSKAYLRKRSTQLSDYCMSWVGTPHVLGGMTRQGVDCSGFVYNVYKDVYDIVLPRRSADMEKEVDLYKSASQMREGDLIFFGKNSVNHVGIFLEGSNFIHTSTSKGVVVSSLEEKYWKENFRSCGHHPKVKN